MLLITFAALFAMATFLFAERAPGEASVPARSSYEVPLGEIVSTSGQKGLQNVTGGSRGEGDDRKYIDPGGYFIDRIGGAQECGASNAFLVDAIDFPNAASASASVFLGNRGTSQPVPINAPNAKTGNHWLVAYLGTAQGSPTNWNIERAAVDPGRIRLTYSNPKIGAVTLDVHRYFYWVPLGALKPGAYHIELYDANLEAVTMMRRVDVPEATSKQAAAKPTSPDAPGIARSGRGEVDTSDVCVREVGDKRSGIPEPAS